MSAGFDQFFTADNAVGLSQGGFASKGDLILNPEVQNAAYYGPTFDGKITILRMLPFFTNTPNGLAEVPYRGGPGFRNFSPWWRSYPAFRSIGQRSKATILLNDPTVNRMWDQNSNQVCIFVREIRNAIAYAKKNSLMLPNGRRLANGSNLLPPAWLGLTEGSAGKGADIPNISSVVLVECLLYQHSSKKDGLQGLPIGLRKDDGPVVFEFTGPLWESCIQPDLDAPNPAYMPTTPDQINFEQAYVNGDPVLLKHGRFLHIYRKDAGDPRNAAVATNPAAMYQQQPQQGAAGQAFEAKGYGAFFTKTLPGYPQDNGYPASLVGQNDPNMGWIEPTIKQRWVPLDHLIKVPSAEEQARILINLFSPDLLMYAWESCPQFITPELRQAAASVDLSGAAHQPGGQVPHITTPPQAGPGWGAGAAWAPPAGAPGLSPPPFQGAPAVPPPANPVAAWPPVSPAPMAAPPMAAPPMATPPMAAPPVYQQPVTTPPPSYQPPVTSAPTQQYLPPAVDPAAAGVAHHAATDFGVPAAAPTQVYQPPPAVPTTAPNYAQPPAAVPPPAPATQQFMPTTPPVPTFQPGQPSGLPTAPGAVAPMQPAALTQPPGVSNLDHLRQLAQAPAQ